MEKTEKPTVLITDGAYSGRDNTDAAAEKNIDLVVCTGFRIHAVKRKHGGKKRTDMAEKMDENITHMLAGCDRNSFIDIFMGKCVVFKDRGKNCFTCYHDSAFGNVCP